MIIIIFVFQVSGYGEPLERFVEGLVDRSKLRRNSALVLGCGAGCSTFMLTKYFNKVVMYYSIMILMAINY